MAKKKNRNRNSASANQNKNNITEIKEATSPAEGVSAAELFGAEAVAEATSEAVQTVAEEATEAVAEATEVSVAELFGAEAVAEATNEVAQAVTEATNEASVEELFGNMETAVPEEEMVTEVEALPVNEAMMISAGTNEAMPSIVVTENATDFMQATADNSGAAMPGIELDTTPRPSEVKAAEDMAAISLAAGMDVIQSDAASGTAVVKEAQPMDNAAFDEAPTEAEEIAPVVAETSAAKTTEIITDDAAYFEAMGVVSGAEPPRDISQITKPRTIEEARLFYANYRPPEKKAEPEEVGLTELPMEEEDDKDKKKMFFYIILGAAALIVLIVCIIMMVTYKRDDGNNSVGGNTSSSQSGSVADSDTESENGNESNDTTEKPDSTDKPASSDDKTSATEKPADSDKEDNNEKPASSTTTTKKPASSTTTKKPSTTTTKKPSTTTTKKPSTTTVNGIPVTPAPETPSSSSTVKPAPAPDTTSTAATEAPKPETTTTTKAPETTTTKKPETTTTATTTTTPKPETTTTTTTKKPETTPTPVPETPKFVFEATNTWNGGGSFTLTNNTDKTVTSWTITLTVPQGFKLNGSWSGEFNLNGTTLTIKNLNWNGEIQPGGYRDFGFQYDCPTEVNFNNYKVNVTY